MFYWAWWISWSPFVGICIARISKGRTVGEFIIALLLVPTLVTLVWMGAFGGVALDQAQNEIGALAKGIGELSLAMFQMLENLPLSGITSIFAIALVLIFFIRSSDLGSLVIDSITSGGKLDAPVPQRISERAWRVSLPAPCYSVVAPTRLAPFRRRPSLSACPSPWCYWSCASVSNMGLAHEWRFVQGPKATAP